ncbi:MAG: hypothetical protein V1874_03070 [Spirochaetota bacterium]
MKINIEGILSNAIDMKNQKNIQEESLRNNKQKIKSDSVEIRNRLASRINIIQTELKTIQSSLTKNQIIKDGIDKLKDNFNNGDGKIDFILDQVKFENKPVLSEFLDKDINYNNIINSDYKVGKLIEKDIIELKGLQIEIENIMASNLADSDISSAVVKIEHYLSKINNSFIPNISEIKPDMVTELIK